MLENQDNDICCLHEKHFIFFPFLSVLNTIIFEQ